LYDGVVDTFGSAAPRDCPWRGGDRLHAREAGRVAAAALLDRFDDLTAVAAANDLLALGLYQELASHGLSCPEDISVVGHNDMPLVDKVHPPLDDGADQPK
jgi:DNA-binding LacI/PurR family transcriptional regulator